MKQFTSVTFFKVLVAEIMNKKAIIVKCSPLEYFVSIGDSEVGA